MKSREKRSIDVFNLAFLDVVSCGFGAIILLLVLALALEPAKLKSLFEGLSNQIVEKNDNRAQQEIEIKEVKLELDQKKKSLKEAQIAIAKLQKELNNAISENKISSQKAIQQAQLQDKLNQVLQTLTDEMRALNARSQYQPPKDDSTIGGIPVDSEYIVFVIDTSGSMVRFAWPAVVKKVQEVLRVYPNVKGLQILNDQGTHMFSSMAGRWIPDTPARRKEVVRRLVNWQSFSNSSPVEGINVAIRSYFKEDKPMSIYVFGDDFSTGNINKVVEDVIRINKKDNQGKPRVRIHAFGFPVQFSDPTYVKNRRQFAHLMRLLAEQNGGSFVGLSE